MFIYKKGGKMATLIEERRKQWEAAKGQFLAKNGPAIRAQIANYLTHVADQVVNPVDNSSTKYSHGALPYLENGVLTLDNTTFRTWTGRPDIKSGSLSIRLFMQSESDPEGYTTVLKLDLSTGVFTSNNTFDSEY